MLAAFNPLQDVWRKSVAESEVNDMRESLQRRCGPWQSVCLSPQARQKNMIVQHVFFHRPVTKVGPLGYLAGQRISGCGFYQAWRRARTAAGCPGSIPHDFRRTAIRNMARWHSGARRP